MKWIIIFCGLIFSVIANASEKKVLNIENWQTDNGTPVYFVRTPTIPMVDIRLVFAAGSAYDGQQFGIASLTNGLIGQATKNLSADQIADEFASIGAITSGSVNRDKAVLALRTLTEPRFFDKAISVFTQIVSQPIFTDKAIERAKNMAIASIQSDAQDPGEIAEKAFYHSVFKNSGYAEDPAGTLATIKMITQDNIKEFYQKYYVAKNMKIIVVGDMTTEQVKKVANDLANHFQLGAAAPQANSIQPKINGKELHINYPSDQTSIYLGQVGVTRNDPNYFPLIVGNMVLGGLPQTSIFYDVLREKYGLVYFAYSQFLPLKLRGPFLISSKTKNQNAEKTVQLFKQLIQQFLDKGPSDKRLQAAKKNIVGGFALNLSSNSNISDTVTNIAFYEMPLNYLDTFTNKVNSVTEKQVQQAFQKTLQPDQFLIVTVGGK